MEPLFHPWHNATEANPAGEPEAAPRFRGKRGTAANEEHRTPFSPSRHYDPDNSQFHFTNLSLENDAQPYQRHARTTVDPDGYTAVRVNLPPIGFNKARVKIAVDDRPALPVIDLEVPAVVVIDPGHGGTRDLPGSAANHATSATGVKEKDMTLSLALKMKNRFAAIRNKGALVKLILTRSTDKNFSATIRASKSYLNGADVFVSLHFNGGAPATRGSEVWIYPDGPPPSGYTSAYHASYQVNYAQDHALARRLLNTAVGTIGSGTHGDGINGYDLNNQTMYARTPANLYQDNESYLKNLPIPGIDNIFLPFSRACLIELAYITNPTDDQWFNGPSGEQNTTNLANSLTDAIIDDINQQP